jgi:hypothetical protein
MVASAGRQETAGEMPALRDCADFGIDLVEAPRIWAGTVWRRINRGPEADCEFARHVLGAGIFHKGLRCGSADAG